MLFQNIVLNKQKLQLDVYSLLDHMAYHNHIEIKEAGSQRDIYPKSSAAIMKKPTAKPVKMRMATRSMMLVRCLPMMLSQLPVILSYVVAR